MKIVLKGRLMEAKRLGSGLTELTLKLDGKVEDVGATGRESNGDTIFLIADRFANTLGLGDEYTVTIVAEPRKE